MIIDYNFVFLSFEYSKLVAEVTLESVILPTVFGY